MHPWLSALLGGVLIGAAATLLLLLNGRVAGISGIVNGLTQASRREEWTWRAAFVAGLMIAGGVAMHWLGQTNGSPASVPFLIGAGLLVGFGTRLGGGCTSGHGVCGIGRGSLRGLVATALFVAAGAATVLLLRGLD